MLGILAAVVGLKVTNWLKNREIENNENMHQKYDESKDME